MSAIRLPAINFVRQKSARKAAEEAVSLRFAVDAIAAVARVHGVRIQPAALARRLASRDGSLSVERSIQTIVALGLRCRLHRKADYAALIAAPKPLIVVNTAGECLLLAYADDDKVRIVHPREGGARQLDRQDFVASWSRTLLVIAPALAPTEQAQQAGTSWIAQVLLRYKRPLSSILATSLILQLTGLATPLLFQVIIDKVLVHRSESTLTVVCAALVTTALLEAIVQWLRGYSIAHTSARIDAQLGSKLFSHLLTLPLRYFDSRPAGQTVARVRELENIRSFLTSQGATSIIDALFSLIYLVVLGFYSIKLTVIVLLSLPAFFLFATFVRVPLRALVRDKFNRGAEMQQHLIESILGSHTIKAMSIEPTTLLRWDERLVAYVRAATHVSTVGALGAAGIQLVSKLCTAAVLYVGAKSVMDNEMTVGALVAFNMISGQLMAPTVRLSNAWQDLQQVQISVNRVGDILTQEPEFQPAGEFDLPDIRGAITLAAVAFRYALNAPEILKGISLEIPAGQVVGIIGPSGSGKSTIARIIQRLHSPDVGKVLIDGQNLAHVPTSWFRPQIGVVLQETYLLNRSIHDNIALGNPSLSRAEVIRLARLAGAHEFIEECQFGYDTPIQERGANLSGGQRQRIAIARALAADPRILILDEATSALDYDSEQAIQRNMRDICANRTVIIIAHRLAAVRDCDRIICLRQGRVVEDGPPVELMKDPDGFYSQMLTIQSGAQ